MRIALAGSHDLFVDVLIDALIASGMVAWWAPGASAAEVLDQLKDGGSDLVLLNLGAIGQRRLAMDLTVQLSDWQMPVIVLAAGDEPEGVYAFIAAGALAAVDKSTSDYEKLTGAIRMAVEGDARAVRKWRSKVNHELRAAEADLRSRRAPFDLLTAREAEILGLMCQGLSAQEIADECYLSMATTRSHIRSVLLKLGVRSQLAAAAMAYASGWYEVRLGSHSIHQI